VGVHLVTGGAGFVGCNLVAEILRLGHEVVVVDDLSLGRREDIDKLQGAARLHFVQADCSDVAALERIGQDWRTIDAVWHLAANSDIAAGQRDPRVDLERTFLTTFAVLSFMRGKGVPALNFASSSAIYGDHGERVLHEDVGPLEPISNYGAMKLASEAQIRAAVEMWLSRANIFRFPNVVGVPATHGVMYDFCRKLKDDPEQLDVLGDGTQTKIYLHVDDLVQAMIHISNMRGPEKYRVFNIGPEDEGVSVSALAETVRDLVSPQARIQFGSERRGWVGDVPRFRYSNQRLHQAGWSPRWSSAEAVRRAAAEIVAQELGR
jgi:UDP-glucose 4-epimerase